MPMAIDLHFLMMCSNTAFLFIWGAWERISAIRKGKQHAETADRDRGSLVILYGTIFLGYGVGIPVAFLGCGRMGAGFPWVSISGFCVILIGLAIRLTAIRTLAKQFTYTVRIVENHELITAGIYRHIRHPSYLGQSLVFLGSGLAFANWLSLAFLFVPIFLASFYRISVEEKVLSDYFGLHYAEYAAKTWRMIPWVY